MGDALAVVTQFRESCAAGCAGRVRSAYHVLVDIVLLVVGECKCDFAFYEHGRKSVICSFDKFFYNDMILPCAAASVPVGVAGFFWRCRAVDALASGQVNWLHDNRESELRNGGFEVCAIFTRNFILICCEIRACNFNCNRARSGDAKTCGKRAVLVLVVNFEACRVGIVPGQSQFFANINRRKQCKIVAA